jgi:hypothetical protein
MTDQDPNSGHSPTPTGSVEPLPAEFDREERTVDALLASSARMHAAATPIGLSQRVFNASIASKRADLMHTEPLPAEFDAELETIDALLVMSASSGADSAPLGLSQRVFEASVAHLPGASLEQIAALRLVGAGVSGDGAAHSVARVGWHSTMWHRLSLAASVVIVGGIALWALTQQPTPPGPVASNHPDGVAAPNGDSQARLAAEVSSQFTALNNLALADDLGDFENELSYLLDATQVLSVADLNHNFDALPRGMDM